MLKLFPHTSNILYTNIHKHKIKLSFFNIVERVLVICCAVAANKNSENDYKHNRDSDKMNMATLHSTKTQNASYLYRDHRESG